MNELRALVVGQRVRNGGRLGRRRDRRGVHKLQRGRVQNAYGGEFGGRAAGAGFRGPGRAVAICGRRVSLAAQMSDRLSRAASRVGDVRRRPRGSELWRLRLRRVVARVLEIEEREDGAELRRARRAEEQLRVELHVLLQTRGHRRRARAHAARVLTHRVRHARRVVRRRVRERRARAARAAAARRQCRARHDRRLFGYGGQRVTRGDRLLPVERDRERLVVRVAGERLGRRRERAACDRRQVHVLPAAAQHLHEVLAGARLRHLRATPHGDH